MASALPHSPSPARAALPDSKHHATPAPVFYSIRQTVPSWHSTPLSRGPEESRAITRPPGWATGSLTPELWWNPAPRQHAESKKMKMRNGIEYGQQPFLIARRKTPLPVPKLGVSKRARTCKNVRSHPRNTPLVALGRRERSGRGDARIAVCRARHGDGLRQVVAIVAPLPPCYTGLPLQGAEREGAGARRAGSPGRQRGGVGRQG